jgi:hypothetical protein
MNTLCDEVREQTLNPRKAAERSRRRIACRLVSCLLWAIAGALLAFVFVPGSIVNPLHRPDEKVRAWLLQQTPIGSSSKEVLAYSGEKGWRGSENEDTSSELADSHISCQLGSYGFPWSRTYVAACWEFDSNDRLTNIQISRTQPENKSRQNHEDNQQ